MTLIISAIFLWANFNLLLSKILLTYNYNGAFFVWILGIPIIITFIRVLQKNKEKIINQDIQFLATPQEIDEMMFCFLTLIDNNLNNREEEILFKGYIIGHEANCLFIDCPLKNVKRLMEEQTHNSLNDIFAVNSTIYHEFLTYINKVYVIGLLKFPKSTALRLSYALFLCDFLKLKTTAKNELENVEKDNPPLNEQFIVFRYKKIIMEEQDTNPTDDTDLVSGIAYDSHFRQCKNFILETAKNFYDFWGALSENENTDMTKLNNIGLKINQGLRSVNLHWGRMQHYKANEPKAIKMYASFVRDILNNKDKSKELMGLTTKVLEMENENFDIEYDDDFADGKIIMYCSSENVLIKLLINLIINLI